MTAKRRRNLLDPTSAEPFPISRAKIECRLKCPRCFWLGRRMGVKPPGLPSMTLNRAVDALMSARATATTAASRCAARQRSMPPGPARSRSWA